MKMTAHIYRPIKWKNYPAWQWVGLERCS